MKLITLLATAAAVLPLLTQAAPVPRQSNIIERQEVVNTPSHAGAELRPRQEAPVSEEIVAPPLSPDTAYPTDGSDDAAGEEDKGPIAPADTTEGNGVQEETTPPTPPQDAPPQGGNEQSDVAYNNLDIDSEQGREANGPEDGSEPQEAGDNSYSAVGEEVPAPPSETQATLICNPCPPGKMCAMTCQPYMISATSDVPREPAVPAPTGILETQTNAQGGQNKAGENGPQPTGQNVVRPSCTKSVA